MSSAKCRKGIKVFFGNCWFSIYSVLKAILLSCNSGCQVKKWRLWDGVSSTPGLLNWLCYCRPVQGEGSVRESGLWFIKYRAFDCDPLPRGWVFAAALSGEDDLASAPPSLYFSQWTPPITTTPGFFHTYTSCALLSSRRSFFSSIMKSPPPFSQHPSA